MKACLSKESLHLKWSFEIVVDAVEAAQVPAALEVTIGDGSSSSVSASTSVPTLELE